MTKRRWTLYPCVVCGDVATCMCSLEECGHHSPGGRVPIEVIPSTDRGGLMIDREKAIKVAAKAIHNKGFGCEGECCPRCEDLARYALDAIISLV